MSDNVNVQIATETKLKAKKKGCLYWMLLLRFDLIVWLLLFIPRLIIQIFKPKKYTIKTTHKSMAVCQSRGNKWGV